MARGRSTRGARDDTYDVAIDPLLDAGLMPAPTFSPAIQLTPFNPYDEVQDARRFSFGQDRPLSTTGTSVGPFRSVRGGSAQRAAPWRQSDVSAVSFNEPRTALECVRRKTRREVIFAKRKHRKGAGSRRRYNLWSKVKC